MNSRLHGMDALRGIAMWLGVVLHSIIAYQVHPRGGWPQDTSTFVFFDLVYNFLHSFRMQLFFVIAGFFANFLSNRIGLRNFIQHRIKRILYPFLISIVIITPLSALPFAYYRLLLDHVPQSELLVNSILELKHWTGLYHLWFLYYLIIYYVIMNVTLIVAKKIDILPTKWNDKMFLGSTVILMAIQFFFYDGLMEPWTGLMPRIGQVLYYGYFFTIGYFIFKDLNFLNINFELRLVYLVLGICSTFTLYFWLTDLPYWVYTILISLQTNLLVLGNIGFFMRIFKNENKKLRYFSDSSYWFYLIHMPLVTMLQIYLINWDFNGALKGLLVIILVTGVSILTYEYFVRYTAIGTLLNGKKVRIGKSKQ